MTERQKQLRDAYKAMKPPMGVYIFECLPTGKAYLGAAQDLRGRMPTGSSTEANNSGSRCWKRLHTTKRTRRAPTTARIWKRCGT